MKATKSKIIISSDWGCSPKRRSGGTNACLSGKRQNPVRIFPYFTLCFKTIVYRKIQSINQKKSIKKMKLLYLKIIVGLSDMVTEPITDREPDCKQLSRPKHVPSVEKSGGTLSPTFLPATPLTVMYQTCHFQGHYGLKVPT